MLAFITMLVEPRSLCETGTAHVCNCCPSHHEHRSTPPAYDVALYYARLQVSFRQIGGLDGLFGFEPLVLKGKIGTASYPPSQAANGKLMSEQKWVCLMRDP